MIIMVGIITPTQGGEVTSTNFQRLQDVSISDSKWEVSFHVRWDLPYRAKPSLQRVIKILPDILTQARSKSPPNSSLQTSIGQIEILKNRAEEIIYNIMSIYKVQDSSLMGKIKKRTVVAPFIGDALNFLFGTGKQSSIDEVNKRIMTLQAKK